MHDLDGDGVAEAPGLLIEGTRTNYFCRSGDPACQRVGLAPGWYYLSVVGWGASVTIDARQWVKSRNLRSWRCRLLSWPWQPWRPYDPLRAVKARGLRFEITAQTRVHVHVHVHGLPTYVQLEDGLFASSYIPTRDEPVTRAADSISYARIYVVFHRFTSSTGPAASGRGGRSSSAIPIRVSISVRGRISCRSRSPGAIRTSTGRANGASREHDV